MIENADTNRIKTLHEVGLKGILWIVFKHNTFKKWPFVLSIVISIACCILIAVQKGDKFYVILQSTSDLIVTVFPGLLGFSLGGYAMVVGFSNADLIKKGATTSKHSVYQILNGIFSLSILFQAIATIICIVITWGIRVDLNSVLGIYFNSGLLNFLNGVLLFIIFLSSVYSLMLTPFVIINLFTLSQLNNLHYTIEKMKEDKK